MVVVQLPEPLEPVLVSLQGPLLLLPLVTGEGPVPVRKHQHRHLHLVKGKKRLVGLVVAQRARKIQEEQRWITIRRVRRVRRWEEEEEEEEWQQEEVVDTAGMKEGE